VLEGIDQHPIPQDHRLSGRHFSPTWVFELEDIGPYAGDEVIDTPQVILQVKN
jgi:hypothetical protein